MIFFKYIQYCQKFQEIGGHHEEKLELKQLFFLRIYLSGDGAKASKKLAGSDNSFYF